MMRVLAGVLLVVLTLPAAAKPIRCDNPATGEQTRLDVRKVKRALKGLRTAMKRRGIHVLDLPEDAQDRRRRLDEDLAAKDWCVVRSHVVALEDAVAATEVDEAFVSDKFSRVERWCRAPRVGTQRESVGKAIANAAAFIAGGRYRKANQSLNQVLAVLLSSKDPWVMPAPETLEGSADDATPRSVTDIDSGEVAKGCPTLAKAGSASVDDMRATIRKLGDLMDGRAIRPIDIEGGAMLVTDLRSYVELGAVWPATRVACAMLAMVEQNEVSLGMVQKRFLHVTKLRGDLGVPPGHEQQFKALVRSASAAMAQREWGPAFGALEELLVLMGEPKLPSSILP